MLANLEKYTGTLEKYCPANSGLAFYKRLVFVCQGNICRSAYADYRAQALGLSSASMGLSTSTGQPAFQLASEAAKRRGLDLNDHLSTDIHDFEFRAGDLLVAMEVRQARQLSAKSLPSDVGIALLGHWTAPVRIHIHDPYGLEPGYFDTCFAVIDNAVTRLDAAWRLAHTSQPDET
jgi:protein-tyrosine phosphatase